MTPPSSLNGIACMIAATSVFVASDCLMKEAMAVLPPLQVALMRGLGGTFWILVFIAASGQLGKLHWLGNPWVIGRGLCEVVGVFCFVLALPKMPLGDLTALYMIAPFILLVAARYIWGEHIGPVKLVLIALGFAGAMLVAQPGGSGFTIYTVLGLLTAFSSAGRDLMSRKVPAEAPSLVAAAAVIGIETIGVGIGSVLFESMAMPSAAHLVMMTLAGTCLAMGQLLVMLAFRLAAPRALAPFFYMFLFWAVLYGYVFFGELPNEYALAGMVLIVGSGLTAIATEPRRVAKPA